MGPRLNLTLLTESCHISVEHLVEISRNILGNLADVPYELCNVNSENGDTECWHWHERNLNFKSKDYWVYFSEADWPKNSLHFESEGAISKITYSLKGIEIDKRMARSFLLDLWSEVSSLSSPLIACAGYELNSLENINLSVVELADELIKDYSCEIFIVKSSIVPNSIPSRYCQRKLSDGLMQFESSGPWKI